MMGIVMIFVVLLLLSAFFSGSEAAMLSLSRLRVKQLVRQKRPNAQLVAKLKESPHRLIGTILVGNNLVNIAAAALATKIAIDAFGDTGLAIATGIMTVLVLLVGEILPKSIGVSHPARVAVIASPLLYFFWIILAPVVFLFDGFASLFRKLFGEPEQERVTQEEVQEVVKASEHDGHLKTREREIIQNVLKLDDRTLDEVMTPRLDVFSLEMHKTISDVIDQILLEGYSRVPVYDTKMDQMRGVIIVKELLRIIKEGKTQITLEQVMQPVVIFPDNKKVDSVLREFQRRKVPFAIVVDEYGLFIGIVTIEDVLEELVGEIYDENDFQESEAVLKLDDRAYLVSGKTLIVELNEKYSFGLPEHEDYNALAGLVTHHFGRIPESGEEFSVVGVRLIIEKVAQHRVVSVKVLLPEHAAATNS